MLLGKCIWYENSKGEYCQDSQYIDFFDCGYKCTFDLGVCVLKNTIEIKGIMDAIVNMDIMVMNALFLFVVTIVIIMEYV